MKNKSLDLSHDEDLRGLARILGRLASAIDEPWFLIGATARDLVLHRGYGLAVERLTDDVDIAIAVPDWARYEEIKRLAADSVPASGPKQRFLIGEYNVDMVPFGALARDGRIAWPPNGEPKLVVTGFEEANDDVILVTLPAGISVRVASIPALVIMKFLAWADRHLDMPRHDGRDLRKLILSYAEDWNQEQLYERGGAYLQKFAFDNELAAAALLGHDLRSLARPDTAEAIRSILKRQLQDDGILSIDMTGDPDGNTRLLEALFTGFKD